MTGRPDHWPDLGALTELGFGPGSALMSEPKLLVDRRFLAALLLFLLTFLINTAAEIVRQRLRRRYSEI